MFIQHLLQNNLLPFIKIVVPSIHPKHDIPIFPSKDTPLA
jgi:hypothetical protein